MRIGTALWIGWLVLAAPMASAQGIDLAPYLRKDPLGTIKISPDGRHYAATVPQEDRTILVVIRRSDRVATAKVGGERHSVVEDFEWVSPTRVVVGMAERFGSEDEPHPTGELYAVDADGGQRRKIFGSFGLRGDEPTQRAAFLIDALPGDDRNVLVSVFEVTADPATRVEKLDVYTGRTASVAAAPVRRATFVTDSGGEVRFAVGAGVDNVSKTYYRAGRGADWQLINDEAQSGVLEWPLGFTADGSRAYLQREQAAGPDAIVAWDAASGARTEVLRDAHVDPYSVIRDPQGGAPHGALFVHDRARTAFFDAGSATARHQKMLEKAFPGQGVSLTSATADGTLLMVATWSDRNPGDFYLFDTRTRAAELVFSRREWIEPARVPPTRAISLQARDGLTLHGFLTTPAAGGKALPTVVLPHGGPYGIFDDWSYDMESHLLADAGYAVLRVNFRGSGNYGRAFLQAGARQWGAKMQDDLTDATRWLVDQGIADPERICIYGASYGGYAALMGVAREPALYRCAVGYVGVYDLELMRKEARRASRSRHAWAEEWIGSAGGLASASPTRLAERIRVPVFLAAGGEDEVAPVAHTRRMEKALRASGSEVESLYFDTEGHGFYTEPHRREYYGRLLAFLHRHLGGREAAD